MAVLVDLDENDHHLPHAHRGQAERLPTHHTSHLALAPFENTAVIGTDSVDQMEINMLAAAVTCYP